MVTRHHDVAEVLSSPSFVNNPGLVDRSHVSADRTPPSRRQTTTADAPEHAQLRSVLRGAFSGPVVEALRPRVEQVAGELLDAVEARGSMDLMDDYAFPLPMMVIAAVLGLPAEDGAIFRSWARILVDNDLPSFDHDSERRRRSATGNVAEYLTSVLAEKRVSPDGGLLSELLRCDLTDDEVMGMVWLLLTDGHEALACSIGNGMHRLLLHPDQFGRLCDDPSLIGPAVEELLRYDPPAATLTRLARTDVELGGRRIGGGDAVTLVVAAANRDEQRFDDPDYLDIERRAADQHISFGKGIHLCVGADLARLECQIAINTVVQRLPALRLGVPVDNLVWRDGSVLRGPRALPVEFEKRRKPDKSALRAAQCR
jgi:cytochrome P450 PksS